MSESFSMTVGVLLHIKLRANAVDVGIFKKKYVRALLPWWRWCIQYFRIPYISVHLSRSMWAHTCVCVRFSHFRDSKLNGRGLIVYEHVCMCVSFLLRARTFICSFILIGPLFYHLIYYVQNIHWHKHKRKRKTQTNHNCRSLSISNVRSLGAWTAKPFF